ncbi:putative RNA polymerase II subunit B1 CTD phosphatase RPAP2 [Clytia hemisphaerica]|uniref:putative RNA polymerase II subunit B1 CTD phosphatase RPAP2 n=1 Tax=Clytia hemisphaerica TaxID=252671 RepID=UPI0034D46D64
MAKQKSRSEIETEVKIHVAAEKKAHFYVEHLAMVDNVTEDELNAIISTIMVHHYLDATEERSISKLCGYPICGNKLSKVKKQQYHISLIQQKVYDMSQRQFFCSDFCFKASKFIENQIPTEPIWLRSLGYAFFLNMNLRGVYLKKTKRTTNFMKKQQFSSSTTPIESDCTTPTTKVKFLHREDKEEVRVNTDGQFEELPEPEEKIQSTKETYDRFDKFEKAEKKQPTSPTKQSSPSKRTNSVTKTMENKDLEMLASLEKAKTFLNEWIEGYTIGDSATKRSNTNSTNQINTNQPRDEKEFQAKVMNFLSKNPDWSNEATLSENFQEKMKVKSNKEKPYMPPVDWKSQALLRKRIVKEKVVSSLDKLQDILELSKSDLVQFDFFSFLDKLKYTRENIVLKTKEWIIVSIGLLLIYSEGCPEISKSFDKNVNHLKRFLTDKSLPDLQSIKNICPSIATKKTESDNIEDNIIYVSEDIDSDDGSISDEDAYGDNIFPPDSNTATTNYECDLSTICEYGGEFEELD